MNVWMSMGRSMCVYRLWECVSEVYVFQYAFPSGKTYLCIYSIYIVSVSFAYNMQTATWWSDSTEVHLKDSRGERHVCMGGIEPDSSNYIPLLWLVRRCSKKKEHWGEILWHFSSCWCCSNIYCSFCTLSTALSLPCYTRDSQCRGQIKLITSHSSHLGRCNLDISPAQQHYLWCLCSN